MKKLILATTLLLTIFSTNSALADSDYMTTDDGYYVYIGSCSLHEDYEEKKFQIKEIVPYTNYPNSEFIKSLPLVQQELIKAVYAVELEPYLEGDFWADMDDMGFDDISIDEVVMNGSTEVLYRVSYGVGGGNGGYMTFRVNKDQSFELLARTFDGELLECSIEFN
jgi:hypothetical protein